MTRLHCNGRISSNRVKIAFRRYNEMLRFLILSDVHANWYALETVLSDAENRYDQIVCCGDLVGYNPHPSRVIAWTQTHCSLVVRGNHDKVVAGVDDIEWFNEVAQAAARWTTANLDSQEIDYLRELPRGPLHHEQFHVFHGSPQDEDEYVTTPLEASRCFPHLDLGLAFFGHTHLQGGFFSKYGRIGRIPQVRASDRELAIPLEPDVVYMINSGAVGQPRDADPRSAYAIFDSDQRLVTLRRVAYPIRKTAADIRKAGLPDVLAFRLFQGL